MFYSLKLIFVLTVVLIFKEQGIIILVFCGDNFGRGVIKPIKARRVNDRFEHAPTEIITS